MKRLMLQNIGQITAADLRFEDLTVLVGPQASGKSITLQWVKFLSDCGQIQEQMRTYGIDYHRKTDEFLNAYFGEGMSSIWASNSRIEVDGVAVDLKSRVARQQTNKTKSVFLIPAQRVLALANGWPKPFASYTAGDPFSVRAYSEELRILMEKEFTGTGPLFPKPNRLKASYRKLLMGTVFSNFQLQIDRRTVQKRLVLGHGDNVLPFMVWSAGQREFVPLLLGLYWLMPPGRRSRRDRIESVIIEEPEMGLHPRAISAVLLLVLELLTRGYKVYLSTHSPQVLEFVWALETLRKGRGSADDLLDLFGVQHNQEVRFVATTALSKSSKVYYFDPGESVKDITQLDPGSERAQEATWGGLLEFSARTNTAVAKTVAEHPDLFGQE